MTTYPTVYLAGPILGCTADEANDWRKDFADRLYEQCIRGISPLRCEPLIREKYEPFYEDPRFGTKQAIAAKNFFDLKECDITLAYLPIPEEGKQQSWGTIGELVGAHVLGKTTILVSNDPKVLDHPLLSCAGSWILNDLEDAYQVIVGVLGGYALGGKYA